MTVEAAKLELDVWPEDSELPRLTYQMVVISRGNVKPSLLSDFPKTS